MLQKHKVYDDGVFSITVASGHSESLVHFFDKILWCSQGVFYHHKHIIPLTQWIKTTYCGYLNNSTANMDWSTSMVFLLIITTM